jgi:glycerol uptake facilitator protein
MNAFISELIGTAILVLLGNGVVANVVLEKSKGQNSGWIVIALGWATAVFVSVFIVAPFSGAHINPAVTLGLATAGKFDWALVPTYLAAQFLGAMVGGLLVYLHYRPHLQLTTNPDLQLAAFSTGPAVRKPFANLFSEIVGTFILVFGVFYISGASVGEDPASLGALDALPVALVVLAVGLSLGGTTGYAINPARDFGPRLIHAIFPMKGKGSSDWSYAWIPVVGPILGGVLAALLFLALQAS